MGDTKNCLKNAMLYLCGLGQFLILGELGVKEGVK
jgi:hypothetical protein